MNTTQNVESADDILDFSRTKKLKKRLYLSASLCIVAIITLFILAKSERNRMDKDHIESIKTMKAGDNVTIKEVGTVFVIDTVVGDSAIITTTIKKSNLYK